MALLVLQGCKVILGRQGNLAHQDLKDNLDHKETRDPVDRRVLREIKVRLAALEQLEALVSHHYV